MPRNFSLFGSTWEGSFCSNGNRRTGDKEEQFDHWPTKCTNVQEALRPLCLSNIGTTSMHIKCHLKWLIWCCFSRQTINKHIEQILIVWIRHLIFVPLYGSWFAFFYHLHCKIWRNDMGEPKIYLKEKVSWYKIFRSWI